MLKKEKIENIRVISVTTMYNKIHQSTEYKLF